LEIENKFKDILNFIGEDVNREGLVDTPKRFIKALEEMTEGYKQNPKDILSRTFESYGDYREMIVLKDIEFNSNCEHHIQIFSGKCHIGYIPNKKVVGVSKLARLVDCFAKRLQIQERMTTDIANSLMKYLSPKGCMVIIEAHHNCMGARGVKKQNTKMITSALRGIFQEDNVKNEFLNLLHKVN
jgi:GTP cyclohydrolase IA